MVNRTRATAPTTPPAMAALFDLEWDVADDTGGEGVGEGVEGEDGEVDDTGGEEVGERRVKADIAKSGL
jgi:hypothetical protein